MASKQYFIRFTNDYVNFRQLEFDSLCDHFGLKYTLLEEPEDKPYFLLETDNSEALQKVVTRSILINAYYELWTSGRSFEQYYENIRRLDKINEDFYRQCSFCVLVETYGRKVTLPYKIERIEALDFLPWDGPIKLKDPDALFIHFEYYGNDRNAVPDEPNEIFFARFISDGGRGILKNFLLRDRKFIANTSMEPNLSFLMANMAQVDRGHLVFDPFVGSGSLLVSSAHFGAQCFGADIDYLLLHGLAKSTRCGKTYRDDDESVMSNFQQYSLVDRYGDVFAGDSSLENIREGFLFDAVITDPPYGRRESRERIGSKKKNPPIPDQLVAAHIPSKLEYSHDDIYGDLFEFGLKNLRLGGRLVFWAPYYRAENDREAEKLRGMEGPAQGFFKGDLKGVMEEELRKRFRHEHFRFVGSAEQTLTARYSRVLVVMQRER